MYLGKIRFRNGDDDFHDIDADGNEVHLDVLWCVCSIECIPSFHFRCCLPCSFMFVEYNCPDCIV